MLVKLQTRADMNEKLKILTCLERNTLENNHTDLCKNIASQSEELHGDYTIQIWILIALVIEL